MRTAAATSSAALLVLVALPGCSSEESRDTEACVGDRCGDAGTDAAVEASSGGGSGAGGGSSAGGGPNTGGASVCAAPPATYPEPPTNVTTQGGNVEVVAVQYSADFGDVQGGGPVMPTEYRSTGFDLDELCTEDGNAASGSCQLPPYASGVPDGLGGRDNAFGALVQSIRNTGSSDFGSVSHTAELHRGSTNLIFRMTEYNGEPNDDQVRLDVLRAAPFDTLGDAGALPKWDGTDVWPVSASSVLDLDRTKPMYSAPNAYVTGNKVVASLTKLGVSLHIGLSSLGGVSWTFELSGAFVVCDVLPTAEGRWGRTFDTCVVGGRLAADDIVHQISAFPDPLQSGLRLCTSSTSYRNFRDSICELVDLHSDRTAPSTASCDALSFGMAFDTKPGNLGDVVSVDPDPSGCTDETDPVHDSCANHGAAPGRGDGGGTGPGDGG